MEEIGNLTIRSDEFDVLVDGRRLGLTRREFELLTVLADRPERVVQRGEIYEAIWGGGMRKRDRAVDVLVRKVRIKLTRAAPEWRYIHTHFGVGYRFGPQRVDARKGSPPRISHASMHPSSSYPALAPTARVGAVEVL